MCRLELNPTGSFAIRRQFVGFPCMKVLTRLRLNFFLNAVLKCAGYILPINSLISVTLLSSLNNKAFDSYILISQTIPISLNVYVRLPDISVNVMPRRVR